MNSSLSVLSEGRENSITFLRLVAALTVIYSHSYAIVASGGQDFLSALTQHAHAGGVAVDFFFMLSGFLVTASILKRGALSYVISRFLRLIPALWFSLLIVCFVIGPLVSSRSLGDYFSDGQVYRYLWSNGLGWSTEWFLPGVFESSRNHAVNGSIWSVVLEMRMYLYLLIFYFIGCFRSRCVFNVLSFAVVFLVWSGVLSLPGISGGTDKNVALLFLLGSFLYVNREYISVGPLFVVVSVALCAITFRTDRFSYAYTVFLMASFCVVVFLKFGSRMEKLGDYSYGVYLWGWPIQQLWVLAFPGVGAGVLSVLSMLSSLVVAVLSWKFLERPILDKKEVVSEFFCAALKRIGSLVAWSQRSR